MEPKDRAKNLIRAEMKRRGLTYGDLAAALARIGIEIDEHNLRNRIALGGFSATFFLQCMEALGVTDLRLK